MSTHLSFKTFFIEGRGGRPDHQTVGRMMNLGHERKHQNFKAEGPKPKKNHIIDSLIKNKSKGITLGNFNIVLQLLKDYGIKHIEVPYIKAIKDTGYWIRYNPPGAENIEKRWIIFLKK
jgi:hypothetical protein